MSCTAYWDQASQGLRKLLFVGKNLISSQMLRFLLTFRSVYNFTSILISNILDMISEKNTYQIKFVLNLSLTESNQMKFLHHYNLKFNFLQPNSFNLTIVAKH